MVICVPSCPLSDESPTAAAAGGFESTTGRDFAGPSASERDEK